MRNFIYIIHKKKPTNIDTEKGSTLINSLKGIEHQFNNYSNDSIECYTYTNENIVLDSFMDDYYFSFSGQLPSRDHEVQTEIRNKNNLERQKYIGNLPGAHAIGFVKTLSNVIKVYTTINRINNVFFFENQDKIVIGVDPLLVSCFAFNVEKPVFDLGNAASFISNGYFTDDNTLFKQVYTVPENTVVTIENLKMKFDKVDNSIEQMFKRVPTSKDYDELTQAYLDAFDIVPKTEKPHNVGLTGGKDSRLITLGLLERKIDFKANTRGYSDHPDVIIAKRIAEKLELDHTVKIPKTNKQNLLIVDIVDKVLKAMIGTSGTLYGYENINYGTEYIGNTGITGVGAEVIRGGHTGLKYKNSKNIGEEFLKVFFPLKNYFLPEVRRPYEDFLIKYGENEKSLKEAQAKHYMFYNVGRRTAGSRIAILHYSNSLSPFFDNRFVKKATKFDIDILTSEKLHYNLTAKLNKEIADMPLAGSRWSFETNAPVSPGQYKEWINRQPVYAKTKKGAYNYRLLANEDNTLREAFKKILFNDPSSEIFKVVDEDLLRELLNKPVKAMLNRFIWSLVSVKIYMDYYNNKLDYGFDKLEFLAPVASSQGVKYPETRDLMVTLRSFNNGVVLEEYGNFIKLNINHTSKSNKYFQTGNGSFNMPANTPKKVLAVPDRISKINIRLYLESETENADIELYIMQYDETEKLKSQSEIFSIKDGKILINYNVNLLDNTQNIKFAFKVNTDSDLLIVKYAFMKMQ